MTDAAQTMEYFFEMQGFRAAKFEVSSGGGLMGCHEPFDLACPVMRPLFDIIEAHNAPVALDVGDLTMPSHPPWSMARIAEDFPHETGGLPSAGPHSGPGKGLDAEPGTAEKAQCLV